MTARGGDSVQVAKGALGVTIRGPRQDGASRRRITVLDDDLPSLQLMRDVLEGEGYAVTPVDRVSATLDELHASRPELIIVDLLLSPASSGLSGWDVVRLSKADKDLRLVPILLISADLPRLRTLVPDAMALHNVLLLGKPFGLDSLTVMARLALEAEPSQPIRIPPDVGDLRPQIS